MTRRRHNPNVSLDTLPRACFAYGTLDNGLATPVLIDLTLRDLLHSFSRVQQLLEDE